VLVPALCSVPKERSNPPFSFRVYHLAPPSEMPFFYDAAAPNSFLTSFFHQAQPLLPIFSAKAAFMPQCRGSVMISLSCKTRCLLCLHWWHLCAEEARITFPIVRFRGGRTSLTALPMNIALSTPLPEMMSDLLHGLYRSHSPPILLFVSLDDFS